LQRLLSARPRQPPSRDWPAARTACKKNLDDAVAQQELAGALELSDRLMRLRPAMRR